MRGNPTHHLPSGWLRTSCIRASLARNRSTSPVTTAKGWSPGLRFYLSIKFHILNGFCKSVRVRRCCWKASMGTDFQDTSRIPRWIVMEWRRGLGTSSKTCSRKREASSHLPTRRPPTPPHPCALLGKNYSDFECRFRNPPLRYIDRCEHDDPLGAPHPDGSPLNCFTKRAWFMVAHKMVHMNFNRNREPNPLLSPDRTWYVTKVVLRFS